MEKSEKQKFEAISFREDGMVGILASALTGSIWNGSCWVFGGYEELKDIAQETFPILSTTLPSGASDLLWLEDDMLAVAMDTSEIMLWKHGILGHSLQNAYTLSHHDRMVLCLDRPDVNKTSLLSSSADGTIVLWNLDTFKHYYEIRAHGDLTWCACYQPESSNVIASTGQDKCFKVWDVRKSEVSLTVSVKGIVSRSLCWSNVQENVLATGREDGSIFLYDIRSTQKEVSSFQSHTRPIHKMLFVPQTSLLASASNDCTVNIQETKKNESRYTSTEHDDFVHGLAWDPLSKAVISCAWDGLVLKHSLPSGEQSCDDCTASTS